MKPLTLIAIALWLSYCATPEETATFQTMEAAMRAGCNIENMVWEPIGEQPRREGFSAIYDYGGGWSMYRDPHKTQCLGRDPEPLECVWGKSVLDPMLGFRLIGRCFVTTVKTAT